MFLISSARFLQAPRFLVLRTQVANKFSDSAPLSFIWVFLIYANYCLLAAPKECVPSESSQSQVDFGPILHGVVLYVMKLCELVSKLAPVIVRSLACGDISARRDARDA